MNSTTEKSQQKPKQRSKKPTPPSFDIKLNRFGFRLLGHRLPWIMSKWAMKLWSRTHRFSPSAREQRMQLRASECSLLVNGIQIKSWMWGEGPIVLLVHGWNGRGLQLNRLIDPLLAAGYKVVCFDAPAHGQTIGKYTHLLEIRDVILAVEKFHGPVHAAVAHSFGVACLSAAIQSGMSISSIVGISSPGGLSSLIQRYCQYMHIPSATEQKLRQRLSHRLGKELWEQFAESYPVSDHVERSLVIHDKDDRLVHWQESQQLAEGWPHSELIYTEGLGHRRILLDPETNNKIVTFIENTVVCDSLDSL